ncbi:MAG: pyruvate dehydrogenase (acetyl-transferring) E1 component subunit alpha [Sandaracinaceae bacterium]|nr:pyruvate dehydrogenase (acetyl-transferring) E1 component subunit alpha [Sandaracinaceae bacterium]
MEDSLLLKKDELLTLYKKMFLIRRFEEEAARAYAQGKIGGFLHLYIGQEAVAMGAIACMRPDDYFVTTYRDHGVALGRGMTARACMAELFGKVTGCSKGFGGSMHMFDRPNNFLGGHGIVGAHVSLAAGPAFKAKYMGEDRITMCFFGDGATNIGGFHEGISLAALWKLPIIFVCENNQYSMGTPISRTAAQPEFWKKAEGYNIPGFRIDGHDVREVAEKFKEPIARARRGEGPTFIEVVTYRYRGHSMSDPGKYRTAAEVEERKKQDPVRIARDALLEMKVKEEELAKIDALVEEEVADAVKFADESDPPDEALMHSLTLAKTGEDPYA